MSKFKKPGPQSTTCHLYVTLSIRAHILGEDMRDYINAKVVEVGNIELEIV